MLLPIPSVGVDPGPQYAEDINSCLTIIDQHNHEPGSGVQITPSGLDINSDLSFSNSNAINLRTVRFQSQGAPLSAAADVGCLYEVSNDLFFNDGLGNQVRITQSGGVAGTPGSISGLVSPASASYSVLDQTFIWQSAANTPANLDAASVIFRNLVANSKGLTVSPPAAMSLDFNITLPNVPVASSFLTIDPAGSMTATVAVSQGITESMLAAAVSQALRQPGDITMSALSSKAGYLFCDGTAVSRAIYANLYAAVGDAFGNGDGSTTFNVPDFRGYFARGRDAGAMHDPDAGSRTALNPGGNVGDNVGSFQLDEFKGHAHALLHLAWNFFGTGSNPNPTDGAGGAGVQNTNVVGGNETRPANVYVNFFIKT